MQICNLKNESVDPDVQCIEMNIGLLEKRRLSAFHAQRDLRAGAGERLHARTLAGTRKRVVLSVVTHHRERLLNAAKKEKASCLHFLHPWHAGIDWQSR